MSCKVNYHLYHTGQSTNYNASNDNDNDDDYDNSDAGIVLGITRA